jgi:glycosyltransferase involved in cell wall biosynthesis
LYAQRRVNGWQTRYPESVRFVLNLLGGILPLSWTVLAADYFLSERHTKIVDDLPPFAPEETAPALSVIVPACNEEEKLPAAMRSLLAQEYPGPFEIVAVDDRSTDGTPALLDALAAEGAAQGKRLVVLHLTELPKGWLGKTHALYRGARRASGEYLLFTDADIVYQPSALSRALRHAETEGLDHLTVLVQFDLRGFWETVFGFCFSAMFVMRFRPARVRKPKTAEYLGIGAFNLVRRTAYEAIGTHRAIALEVADDMELGHRIKQAGFRSEVAGSRGVITVRWQEGLSGLMGGLMKNAYAGSHYSLVSLFTSIGLVVYTVIWPTVGLFTSRNRMARARHAVSLGAFLAMAAHHARRTGIPVGYTLTLPFSILLLLYVMCRSAYITEKNGGITWRGTFYPLDELRARTIPPVPDDTEVQ